VFSLKWCLTRFLSVTIVSKTLARHGSRVYQEWAASIQIPAAAHLKAGPNKRAVRSEINAPATSKRDIARASESDLPCSRKVYLLWLNDGAAG